MRPRGIAIHGAVWDFTPLDDADGSDGAGCLRFDVSKAARLRDALTEFLRQANAPAAETEPGGFFFLRVL